MERQDFTDALFGQLQQLIELLPGEVVLLAGGLNLIPFIPALLVIGALHPGGAAGLAWLAVAFFGVYMIARLVTLGWRVRRGAWLRIAV